MPRFHLSSPSESWSYLSLSVASSIPVWCSKMVFLQFVFDEFPTIIDENLLFSRSDCTLYPLACIKLRTLCSARKISITLKEKLSVRFAVSFRIFLLI